MARSTLVVRTCAPHAHALGDPSPGAPKMNTTFREAKIVAPNAACSVAYGKTRTRRVRASRTLLTPVDRSPDGGLPIGQGVNAAGMLVMAKVSSCYDRPRHVLSFKGGRMCRPGENDGGSVQPNGARTNLSTLVEVG